MHWFGLDIRTRSEVLSIDRQNKRVKIRDLDEEREYEESYDKLILSPGAEPLKPPIKGVDLPNVFTLRNLQDSMLVTCNAWSAHGMAFSG